jgi:pimeloyl-ACP methyl ester carboxylesterase
VSKPFVVTRGGSELAGERWPGGAPVVVLLHAGVADRRSWRDMAALFGDRATLVAYDRRGYGESAVSLERFRHVDDLLAVLDEVSTEPAWLVGNSMGGGEALDATLLEPERVAGLVLLAPAVGGAPEPELDPVLREFERSITAAIDSGDIDEINRLETWLWLDGPAGPEGRVGGGPRALALEMNATILRSGVPEDAGASGIDTWHRLDELQVPTTVACGDLDVAFLVTRSRELARRLPRGRHRVLDAMAHLPALEQPKAVAELLTEVLTAN